MDLVGAGPTAVDTALFIYLIEESPRYLAAIRPLFEQAQAGERLIVTSAITLLEVLVVPYRAADVALADRYEALLTRARGIQLVEMTRDQLRAAAQLRAHYGGLRTPDAMQLAAALRHSCTKLVTNDRRFPAVPGIEVLQLSEHV